MLSAPVLSSATVLHGIYCRLFLGPHTYSETRRETTDLCRTSSGPSEIAIRFVKHDFRAKKSYVFFGTEPDRPPAVQKACMAAQLSNHFWDGAVNALYRSKLDFCPFAPAA